MNAPGPPAPLAAGVHAEWTKLRTVPSTGWLLLAAVTATVLLGAATAASAELAHCPSGEACLVDTTQVSLAGVWLGQAVVAVLAVLAVTNEYATRMILTSLAANPRRGRLLFARTAVVAAVVLAAATVAVAGSLLAGRLLLPGGGFPEVSLAAGPTLRAATGTVLYLGLVALLSVGVGLLVRDSAGAVATVLTLLYGFPVAAALLAGDPQWYEWLQRIGPTTAGLAVQHTIRLDQLPIGPWAGLGVLAGYAAAALLLGAARFTRSDA